MFVFLLQKKCRLQFDESNNEGMTGLLEATTITPSTTVKKSLMAKEARVESSDRVDGARGASPIIKDTEEVVDMPLGDTGAALYY